ncbi:unnamed protein product [Linum tenue]|uniref:Uncharacterized protein n=1 Tax=Linum tenue TaxID=586396 RepID=A0AAV0RTE6_9ROSI|nr:unnamed protein product [Linum tenue]
MRFFSLCLLLSGGSNSVFEEYKEEFWIWLVWKGFNCWVSKAFLGLRNFSGFVKIL